MTTLTVLPSGKSYEVASGVSLLAALQSVGEAILSKCGGNAKCQSCHVAVPVGRKSLSRIDKVENERLDSTVGVGSTSRLACQAILGEEAVTVQLL